MKLCSIIIVFLLSFYNSIAQPCNISNNTISAASATICTGSSAQINGSTPAGSTVFTYSWLQSTVGAAGPYTLISGQTGINLNTVALTSNRWYKRIVNISCTPSGSDSDTSLARAITVNANNTFTLTSLANTNNQTVCVNTAITQITFSTVGATGINTSGSNLPNGVNASWNNNTITISGTPSVSGTFAYSILLTGGCGTVSVTGTITVTSLNTAGTASTNPTVCVSTTLTPITHTTAGATGISNAGVSGANGLPAGVNATWSNNTISISGTPTVAGTFGYSIPLTGGCGAITATGTITVTPANTITLTSPVGSNAQTKCINTAITNITYSTTGATGISNAGVSGANGLPAGVNATWSNNTISISGTPTVAGTFAYSIPVTGGCGAITATGTITVTPSNTISLTSAIGSNSQTRCINSTITNITYGTTGATDAVFSGLPAGVLGSWSANFITITGSPTVSGSFNYTVTLIGGCGGGTASGSITVTPVNTVTTASSTPTICTNSDLIPITHATTGATSIGTPTGMPTGVLATFASNTINISGTPVVSGIFNYAIPLIGGCGTFSATGAITVNPKPSVTNQSLEICSDSSFLVSPVNGGGNIIPSGTNYTWQAPINSEVIGLLASNDANVVSGNLFSTTYENHSITYSVTPSTAQCIGSPFNVNVTLLRKPNIITIEDQQICSGNSVQLYAADLFGNQNLFYNWSQSPDASTLNFPYIPNPVASPSSNSSYVVSVIDPNTQCVATDSLNVDVIQVENLVISSSLSSICEGDTAVLSLNNLQANWYANGQLLESNVSQVEVSPANSTVYNAVFQNSACTVEDVLTLNVNPKPTPSINGDLTACENAYWQEYNVNSSDEHGYQWDVANGEIMSGQGTRNVLVHWFNGTEGDLTVREVIWSTGCDATAELTVSLNGLAPEIVPVTQLAAGSNVLVCEDSTFSIYNWGYESKTNPGALFLNVNTQYCNFDLLDPTNYYYFVEHGNDENCLTRSYFNEPAVVSGIDNGTDKNQGRLICWPNPAQNSLTIGNLTHQSGNSQLHVYNSLGALIEVKSYSAAKEFILDVSDLNPGLYFVEIVNSSINKRVSFVKL
jgi:hypothetical protein